MTIQIVPYSSKWPTLFAEEASFLPFTSYHIGSTAIPGLKAKPIIDILGVVDDIRSVGTIDGYTPHGSHGMPRRRYFKKSHPIAVNLHIFEEGNPQIARHLLFAEYLKTHPKDVQAYQDAKEFFAKQHATDIETYTLGKAKFISEIDRKALAWWKAPLPHFTSKPKDLSQEEIVSALFDNFHLLMTYFANFTSPWQVIGMGQATVVFFENIKSTNFNYVLNANFSYETVHSDIQKITNFFTIKRLPFTWWKGPFDTPDNLAMELILAGYLPKEDDVGMFLQLSNYKHTSQSALQVRRVVDKESIEAFDSVLVASGGNETAYAKIYSQINERLYLEGPVELYTGYIDGRAATTGIVVFYANVAGIYYISTDPKERKKGYATHMMHHLLQRAIEKGYLIATLAASNEGKPIYEKLGFQTCCLFQEFTLSCQRP